MRHGVRVDFMIRYIAGLMPHIRPTINAVAVSVTAAANPT